MRRDQDSSDIFDDDELTLDQAWAKDQSTSQNEAPFKICLNFIREDEHSPALSIGLDYTVSDYRSDSRELSYSEEKDLYDYTENQIYRINNVNEKLRILVLYENQNPDFIKSAFTDILSPSKNKAIKKSLSDQDIEFFTRILDKHGSIVEKALEPIKMTRLASIPQSKRKFHLNKIDMEDIEKKKALKALTIQKVNEFEWKKGQAKGPFKKQLEDQFKIIEQILTEPVSQIQENRIIQQIDQIMLNEQKETQRDLKASVQQYYAEMKRIHEESSKIIQQSQHYRDLVLLSKNMNRIQSKRKTKHNSSDINTILGIGNFFNMVPNIGQEDEQIDKTQLSLDASFSKDF